MQTAALRPYVVPPDEAFQDALAAAGLEYTVEAARAVCDILRAGGVPADPTIGFRGQTPAEYLAVEEQVGSGNENEQAIALAIQYFCPDQRPAFDRAKSGDYPVAPPLTQFGDGNWIVGIDIQPGTYRTSGQVSGCYWERTTAAGDIIDNDFITAALQAIFTVQASDALVSSSGCGTWTRQG